MSALLAVFAYMKCVAKGVQVKVLMLGKMMARLCVTFFFLLLTAQSFAEEGWLIVTPNEVLNLNEAISLVVVKPNDEISWPEKLSLTLSNQVDSEVVELLATTEKSSTRRHYKGKVTSFFKGDVLAQLTNQPSNRLLMTAKQLDVFSEEAFTAKSLKITQEIGEQEPKVAKTILIPKPKEERTISANEPLYFIVGSSDERDFDARFQISFKYRPFDPGASVATFIPYASNLYFAYTQTSIWDLGSKSSPFKDTSYRPSVYYNWDESDKGLNPSSWKFGLEHESNGRAGDESRSLNIAFIQPSWSLGSSGGKRFTFMPKIYTYIEKSDNRDIQEYRGYADWIARYGRDDAAILTAMYRLGTKGYTQGQIDLSYPISDKIFGRTGTFLHFQLLGGYGETLIDYNKKSETQLRVGISLAR
jgi:phospholipase A1